VDRDRLADDETVLHELPDVLTWVTNHQSSIDGFQTIAWTKTTVKAPNFRPVFE
jgi:hypothetical protein